jgi:hypothetical protein
MKSSGVLGPFKNGETNVKLNKIYLPLAEIEDLFSLHECEGPVHAVMRDAITTGRT